ncbi:MAG: hypothetical protein EA390_14625 [Balneolaceae bacterium]|nr:MAG: hypothetical protein EA390_14625 [Balneolaceae bacterium]
MVHKFINRTTTLLFLVASSFIFIQCNDRADNRSSAFDEDRQEMKSNLESLRDDIDYKINDLESRIDNASDNEVERNLEAQRNELRNDRSNVDRAIDDLEDSTRDSWQTVRTETEDLYERISSKLEEWSDRMQDQFNN